MSSHHIVREGQEPALFVFEPISYERIAPLLEWAPYVLVTDKTLELTLSWGIRVDSVVCPFGKKEELTGVIADFQEIEIVQEEDILQAGLSLLLAKGQHACTITIQDRTILNVMTSHKSMTLTLLEPDVKWVSIHGEFQKWVPAGTQFMIHETFKDQPVKVTGCDFNGEIFQAQKDGLIGFESEKSVWIGEFS